MVSNSNSPWRTRKNIVTIQRYTVQELEIAIENKIKEGYELITVINHGENSKLLTYRSDTGSKRRNEVFHNKKLIATFKRKEVVNCEA